MVLKYNITGEKRKQLVGAASKEINAPTKYLGAPSFSYQVVSYTIDKNGVLSGPDNLDLEDALHRAGFDADEREYDEPDTYESGLGGMFCCSSLSVETRAYPATLRFFIKPGRPCMNPVGLAGMTVTFLLLIILHHSFQAVFVSPPHAYLLSNSRSVSGPAM